MAGPQPGADASAHTPLLSIVVETWNEDPLRSTGLAQSLAALARQTVPIDRCEVLVVIQKDAEALVEVARSALPSARVVIPDRLLGYGQMKMCGARAASCEIVAHTDADCIAEPTWVAAVLDGFRDAPQSVGIVQGLTRHAEGPGWQAATLHYFKSMWSPTSRGTYLVLNNFAIRRTLFERFPFADVPARQNVERLLVKRMRAAGYTIRIEPRMRVTHGYRGGPAAWFQRGRAEAYDRLESLRLVYAITEPAARMTTAYGLPARLRHHTRRSFNTLRELIRCRRELGVGPSAFLVSALAAVTIWAGTCVGAWQASRGRPQPPAPF